jgi:hypothetical protein
MNAIHTEMLYFQRRLDDTLALAAAAAGPCARVAHETLARLYGETLDVLSVESFDMSIEPLLVFAPRGARTAPRMFRPAPHRARPTLKLAC